MSRIFQRIKLAVVGMGSWRAASTIWLKFCFLTITRFFFELIDTWNNNRYTVESGYYMDRLLRYISYYIGNSKHQTISYINLYKLLPLLRCPKMLNRIITM